MSPAQRRLAAAATLDAHRNSAAIAESRLACLPYAAARLASEVIDGHEFAYKPALGGCPRADVPDTTRRARRRGDVPTSPAST